MGSGNGPSCTAESTSPEALSRSNGEISGIGPNSATGRPRSVTSNVSPASTRRKYSLARCRSSRIPIESIVLFVAQMLCHRALAFRRLAWHVLTCMSIYMDIFPDISVTSRPFACGPSMQSDPSIMNHHLRQCSSQYSTASQVSAATTTSETTSPIGWASSFSHPGARQMKNSRRESSE